MKEYQQVMMITIAWEVPNWVFPKRKEIKIITNKTIFFFFSHLHNLFWLIS